MVSVGRDRSGLFEPAVVEYQKRLSHYTKLELLELPEARGDKAHAMAKEAAGILGAVGPNAWLVALDERGKSLSSVELSQLIHKAQNGSADLVFAIGGDEGLAPEVRERARVTLSLSKMTLPHRMARMLLMEQLYRAFTILRGEPYHK